MNIRWWWGSYRWSPWRPQWCLGLMEVDSEEGGRTLRLVVTLMTVVTWHWWQLWRWWQCTSGHFDDNGDIEEEDDDNPGRGQNEISQSLLSFFVLRFSSWAKSISCVKVVHLGGSDFFLFLVQRLFSVHLGGGWQVGHLGGGGGGGGHCGAGGPRGGERGGADPEDILIILLFRMIIILHDGNVNGEIGDPEDILELILLFRIIWLFLMALILVIF